VAHSEWLWVLLALCIAAMAFLRARHFAPTEKAMQWPDALGLGLFSATGTQLALAQDLPGIVAVLMGVITATFGGVLRDVVCNEIPTAFSDHRPYAICAFIGGWVLVLAQHAGLAASLALVLGAACATGLRVARCSRGSRCRGGPRATPPDAHTVTPAEAGAQGIGTARTRAALECGSPGFPPARE
jgi:uncharacterized membrane protein YeiH